MEINPFTDVEDLGNGRFRAKIEPIVGFWDADGKYKLHELVDEMETKGCLIVKNKCICAEIYPTHVSYWERTHSEQRVKEEIIFAEELEDISPQEGWVPRKVLNHWGFEDPEKIKYAVEVLANELRVKKWVDFKDVTLEVTYILGDGAPLKHQVTLTNKSGRTLKLWFIMKWKGMRADKVMVAERAYPMVPFDLTTASPILLFTAWQFFFLDKELKEIVCEDLTNLYKRGIVGSTRVYTHADGTDVTFYFLFFEVAPRESVTLDPTTWTNSDPAQDGFVYSTTDNYGNITWYKNTTATRLTFGKLAGDYHFHRAYVEWDVSAIPDNAKIQSVKFRYHGYANYVGGDGAQIRGMENQPSSASASTIHADCGDGTIFYEDSVFPEVGENKEIDLGPDACSDLQANLGVDWWAIGMKTRAEQFTDRYGQIYSEEYASANPKPTLEVVYYLPSGTTLPATKMEDSAFLTKKYGKDITMIYRMIRSTKRRPPTL